MKYCSNCGMNHPDAADRCANCGAVLPAADFQTRSQPFAADRPEANTVKEPLADYQFVRIESHLVKAVISAICCCLPFGIAAIVFAAQVGPNLKIKDFEAACEAGKKANFWANMAIGVGVAVQILWLVFSPLILEVFSRSYNG